MVLSDPSRAFRAGGQALGGFTRSHLVIETLPSDENNLEWNLSRMTKKVIDIACLCRGSVEDMIDALNEEIDALVDTVSPVDEESIKDVVNKLPVIANCVAIV